MQAVKDSVVKEEIFGSIPWCYTLTKQEGITVRYFIVMKGIVDGDALRKAVDITMTRYPYLAKELVVTKDRYYYIHNPRPVVVRRGVNPMPLGGREANYHQLSFGWFNNTIIINNTHAIFDGRGRGPLLHTLMYYYCTYRYGTAQTMPGVNLAGSPVDPAEYCDPYQNNIPQKTFQMPQIPSSRQIMRLDEMGIVTVSHEPQLHIIRVNEKQLMSVCKSSDGTPNTAVTLLMCRAIKNIHKYSTLPIVAGVYCDLRNALNAPLTHHSLVTTLDLEYDQAMSELSFSDQNTAFRGKMMLMSDPSYLLQQIENDKKAFLYVSQLPTARQKSEAAWNSMNGLFKRHTFLVSYSGRSNFGSCDQYILGTSPQPYAHDIGMIMEITSAGGWFDITLAQEWNIDIYFDAFLKELSSHGLDYQLLYSRQISHCPYDLPDETEQ